MTVIARDTLLSKLDLAVPALASVGSIPTLQDFLFTGDKLVAYNDRIGIVTALDTGFKGAVPGALLREVVGVLTHATDIDLAERDQQLSVGAVNKRSLARLPVRDPELFEQLFKLPSKPRAGYEPDAAFFTAIDNCLQSVPDYSTDMEKLGVTLVPDNGKVLLYATDGPTMSHARLPGHDQFKHRCTLPLEFCQQLLKFKDADKKVLTVARDHALLAADDTLLFGRLLAVDRPLDFAATLRRYLPNSFPNGMPAPTDDERKRIKIAFELATRMTDHASDERTDISISGGKLKLKSTSSTRGQASDLLWYKAHPDVQCRAQMELVMRGFSRYSNLLIRSDVVLQSSGENVYLVAAME